MVTGRLTGSASFVGPCAVRYWDPSSDYTQQLRGTTPNSTDGLIAQERLSGGMKIITNAEHDLVHALLVQLIRATGLLQPEQARPDHPVSLSEGFALAELAVNAPLAQRDLAARLHLEKSTVSRMVTALERRGLVTRARNLDNRRLFQLRLTDEGRAVASQLVDMYRERHARLLAALTSAERDALAIGLGALLRELNAETSASAAGDSPSPR
jgi:DNA-binding MarR family transcriptional regulator